MECSYGWDWWFDYEWSGYEFDLSEGMEVARIEQHCGWLFWWFAK